MLGHNVRSPVDLVREEIEYIGPQPKKVKEWLLDLNNRLDLLRESAREVGLAQSDYRKLYYDGKACVKVYSVGDKVLLRSPGLHSKLEETWEGPYEVLEVVSAVNVRISLPEKKKIQKVVHVNLLSPYLESDAKIARLVMVVEEEASQDCMTKSSDKCLLNIAQNNELQQFLDKWQDSLTDSPGKTAILKHTIATGQHSPVRSHPYLIPESKQQGVRDELQQLLKAGIIVPSQSPWASPIVPIVKSDGSIRVCVDYRKINAITFPDPYYMPLVEELIGKVGNCGFLSKLDLSKGFYQVEMEESSQEKTAFVTPMGKYQFTRMPFGLRNAPSTFQRLMDLVLCGAEQFAAPYIDDVLVYSTSWSAHLTHLEAVMSRLHSAGLTVKPSKCLWAQSQVEYLGYLVGNGTVAVPEARVKAIRDYKLPVTKADLKSFLGLLSYYRKFIPTFASITKPLNVLTHRDAKNVIQWEDGCLASVNKLVSSLCHLSILHIPLSSDSFLLQTDTSYFCISGCLSVCRDNQELPVAFYSRQLRDAETRYSISEIECLAAVESIKHFLVYLDGRHFTLQKGLRTSPQCQTD